MGKKKKVFTTKKNVRWKIIDIIVYIIIFILSIKNLFVNGFAWTYVYTNSDNPMIWIFWTIIIIFMIVLTAIPYLIVYLALRYAVKKYNKSTVTFDVEQDLDYYREKFNGVSPATMSLLMDLNLETDKDLGAMKLYYELNDIYLYIKDGSQYLNNPNGIKLNKSDDILLNYFFNNKNRIYALNEWKENVICESVNNNLIVRKNSKEKKKAGCGIFLLLHILAFSFIVYYMMNCEYHLEVLETIIASAQNDIEALNLVVSNPDYTYSLIMSFSLVVAMLVYFWSIIGGFIHLIVGSVVSVKDKFKRTREGNILTEKLCGMKNFIHDFSNLDEATKKHLVLWKDFLVYAVVLEENDTILSEISNMYHTDLSKYKNYKN